MGFRKKKLPKRFFPDNYKPAPPQENVWPPLRSSNPRLLYKARGYIWGGYSFIQNRFPMQPLIVPGKPHHRPGRGLSGEGPASRSQPPRRSAPSPDDTMVLGLTEIRHTQKTALVGFGVRVSTVGLGLGLVPMSRCRGEK